MRSISGKERERGKAFLVVEIADGAAGADIAGSNGSGDLVAGNKNGLAVDGDLGGDPLFVDTGDLKSGRSGRRCTRDETAGDVDVGDADFISLDLKIANGTARPVLTDGHRSSDLVAGNENGLAVDGSLGRNPIFVGTGDLKPSQCSGQ